MKKIVALFTSLLATFTLSASSAVAQITNPAIPTELGGNAAAAQSGTTFTSYFITLWRGVIFVGGIMVLVYFLWGGVEWITAGGDQAKVGKARDKMTQAVVGLIILVASFSIIGLISQIFFPGMNLLQLTIPTSGGATN